MDRVSGNWFHEAPDPNLNFARIDAAAFATTPVAVGVAALVRPPKSFKRHTPYEVLKCAAIGSGISVLTAAAWSAGSFAVLATLGGEAFDTDIVRDVFTGALKDYWMEGPIFYGAASLV